MSPVGSLVGIHLDWPAISNLRDWRPYSILFGRGGWRRGIKTLACSSHRRCRALDRTLTSSAMVVCHCIQQFSARGFPNKLQVFQLVLKNPHQMHVKVVCIWPCWVVKGRGGSSPISLKSHDFFKFLGIFEKNRKKNFFWKKNLDGPKKKSFQFHPKKIFLSNIVGQKYLQNFFQRNRGSGTSFARASSSFHFGAKMSPNQGFHVEL